MISHNIFIEDRNIMGDTNKLKDVINDLTLCLEMWIDGYPFDENHIYKQKELIKRANKLIGKPNSIEEIADEMGCVVKKGL